MQALRLLHKALGESFPEVHRSRLRALLVSVEGLLRGRELWLSELGRHLPGRAKEKHKIKRVDRLLGNPHLQHERLGLYRWLARQLMGGCRHPSILVDWSDVDAAGTLFVLRAAVSVGGRALPLYEEVHPRCNHPDDHRRFLERLAEVLPEPCQPVLVTDAGFRGPWFQAVQSRGWFYVGRLRNRHLARTPKDNDWFPIQTLYPQATATPKRLGELWLSRDAPWQTCAYLYRKSPTGRHRLTVHGQRRCNAHSEKHARREREPWLLVSNLPHRRHIAKQVVALYRERMTIEEGFRDLKANRHGFALRNNLGRNAKRLAILLLIAAFAIFVLWLTGLVGIARQLDRGLQANTTRRRRVLSTFFIGTRLLYQRMKIKPLDIRQALQDLHNAVSQRSFQTA